VFYFTPQNSDQVSEVLSTGVVNNWRISITMWKLCKVWHGYL